MGSRIRVGIVGCGGISKRHRDGYQEILKSGVDTFEIAACCDLNHANAAEWAKEIAESQRREPDVFSDLGDMLKASLY